MIDPQALLEGLTRWVVPLSPEQVQSTLIGLAVSVGLHRLIQYGQRGQRLGKVSGSLEVVRTSGWWRDLCGKAGLSPRVAETFGTGLGLGVFLVFTYLSLEQLSLPFRPWTPGLLAAAATVRFGIYIKSLKGKCVGYEKGLLIEGSFYVFEKLSLEPEPNGVSLRFGKARLSLGWVQFERNKRRIRSDYLHLKFDAFQNQRAAAANPVQDSST